MPLRPRNQETYPIWLRQKIEGSRRNQRRQFATVLRRYKVNQPTSVWLNEIVAGGQSGPAESLADVLDRAGENLKEEAEQDGEGDV